MSKSRPSDSSTMLTTNPWEPNQSKALVYRTIYFGSKGYPPIVDLTSYICINGENTQECRISAPLPRFALGKWKKLARQKKTTSEKGLLLLKFLNSHASNVVNRLLHTYSGLTEEETTKWIERGSILKRYSNGIKPSDFSDAKYFERLCVRRTLEMTRVELEEWFRKNAPEEQVRKLKVHAKPEYTDIQSILTKLEKKRPNATKHELIEQIAQDKGKSYEAVKRLAYYRPKKLQKKLH